MPVHTATIPLTFTLGPSSVEFFADVRFTFHPGDGRRFAGPTDIDPPEPPSVDDVEVLALRFTRDGALIPVPNAAAAEIAEGVDHDALIEIAMEADADARERAAEYRSERAREDREFDLAHGGSDA